MKEACAVTGASGYVGSRLAERLCREFAVITVGRSGDVKWEFGMDAAEALRQHEVKVLLHAAWDFTRPAVSVSGSRKLMEDARASGVERIVFVSTLSAFAGAVSEYGKAKLQVEEMVLGLGGTVIRPGLVWGARPGGMFGSLREQVKRNGVVPVIGNGRYAQYLVHEDDLAEGIARAMRGEFAGRVLTVAHPKAWMLRDLILRMAEERGTRVRLVGLPWRVVYGGLRLAEVLGAHLGFRADSVLSLVRQDPSPEFSPEVSVREFM